MGDEERREAERLAREQAERAVGGRDIAEQLAGILDRLTMAGERRDARLDAATTKNDWALLDRELSKLYCNEEEKQNFLANPGGFKKFCFSSSLQYNLESS